MKAFKLLILLIVALVVFGSVGYFAYELFVKPAHAEKMEKAIEAAQPIPTPTPDPSIAEFKRLKTLLDAGHGDQAYDGLKNFITRFPQSPSASEARQHLGNLNMMFLFQPGSTNVVSYTVVKGDSLVRIASLHHSNAELIQKANSLPGINLRIGEELMIPSLKVSLELDRSAKTLTLLNNGSYLKEYALLSVPPSSKQFPLTSSVLDKVAMLGNKRIAFGDKSYPLSQRSILLAQSPAIVAPLVNTTSTATTPSTNTAPQTPSPLPAGYYVLSSSDLLEIFPLVSRNTPVMIH